MGLHISLINFYKIITTTFSPCSNPNVRCFVVNDNGYITAHRDYYNTVTPPVYDHITVREPGIAADLVRERVLKDDDCANFGDVTSRAFWKIDESRVADGRSSKVYPVDGTNLYIIVPKSQQPQDSCFTGSTNETATCQSSASCQYPCANALGDYNFCTGSLDKRVLKICTPTKVPPLFVTPAVNASSITAASLPDCRPCETVGLFTTQADCLATLKCCWSATNSRCQSACP